MKESKNWKYYHKTFERQRPKLFVITQETQDKKSMNFNMNQPSLKANFTHKEIRIASNSQQIFPY